MVKNMPKKYYTRIIENELDQMLGIFGAVLIEGPKWCGKTTTAGTRAASRLLLMDPSRNFENRLRAETDPALAVAGEVPRLIDEWRFRNFGTRRGLSATTAAASLASSYLRGRRRRETMNGRCTVALEGSLNCAWIP